MAEQIIDHYNKYQYFPKYLLSHKFKFIVFYKLIEFLIQVDYLPKELAELSELLKVNGLSIWKILEEYFGMRNSLFREIMTNIFKMAGQHYSSSKFNQKIRNK